MQECLGEGTTDFVRFIFFFFVAIKKLLDIFVPRGRPLYQDEFSYCKNMFSSDNKETQIGGLYSGTMSTLCWKGFLPLSSQHSGQEILF